MNLFANFRPRVTKQLVRLVMRELPGKGEVLAQVGQEVTPDDVLGVALTSAGFRIINLAKEFSASPEEAGKLLQKDLGQTIFRGEVLGLKNTFLGKKKIFISPTDGVLESYDSKSGNLKIAFLPERKKMLSAVYGIIEKIDQERGQLIIKTEVVEITGVLGSGKIREGNLSILGDRGSLTNRARIISQLTDRIVVVGGLVYEDALRAAVSISVRGIITGGIDGGDFKAISGGNLVRPPRFPTDIGLSLIVTEGFGSIPVGEDIFSVLVKYKDKFAVLDGSRKRLLLPSFERDCMIRIKAMALPRGKNDIMGVMAEPEAEELKIGQSLRVIAPPFMGEQGKLMAIDKSATHLASGLNIYLLTIETKRRKLKVPYSNVEIIG